MFNLVITLASDVFFFKPAKYLLFFHFAQLFVLLNVLNSHLIYFPKFCLIHFVYYLNLILIYFVAPNHLNYLIPFSNCSISLVYFISFLRFSFFINDTYLMSRFLQSLL